MISDEVEDDQLLDQVYFYLVFKKYCQTKQMSGRRKLSEENFDEGTDNIVSQICIANGQLCN